MDKQLILAVAGSGKTSYLIDKLNEIERFLIVTFTNNNVANIKSKIFKKFGYFPNNIKLFSYFTFLYNFCFKPYLHDKYRIKGINYSNEPIPKYHKLKTRNYYIDNFNRIYYSRISKLILDFQIHNSIIERISKYFDNFYIDEIQDFGGNDFNLLKEISKANVNHIYVGDFYQHTFDTSRDGNTNQNLHKDINPYIDFFIKMGFNIDSTTLSKSYRCSPTICNFISEKLQITIESNREDSTEIIIVENEEEAKDILKNNSIVKLFYQKHNDYDCFSNNWGKSKGIDKYNDVCVVLNKTSYSKFTKNKLYELNSSSKNRLYVALSRTRGKLYLMSDALIY